ncbi:MAG: hypothetical protein IT303_08810 [Dehalococcoidia bacterium]|nr:hypothetical protein [Dehalococcoidia bacterium]
MSVLTRARTRRATQPGPRPADPEAARLYRIALLAAIVLGIAIRAFHVLNADFPLNDGALFYVMVRDLQANSYQLPAFTTFNDADIPFGYPPLAMYVAAFLDDITPIGLLTWFRLLPMLATCGTVAAFALLARDLLRSRLAVVGAVLAFALIPRTFIWLLMGGGLTRSFGLLFALLALHQAYRLYAAKDRRYLPGAILLSAATVLSHVETGWFLAFSIGLFWLAYGRHRHSIVSSAALAGGTVLLTAPWWGTVLSYHGPGPFLAAQEAGGSFFTDAGVRRHVWLSLARVVATSEPWYPLLGTIGFVGAVISIASRRYVLAAWWVAVAVFDPRAYPTLASVPVALLAGVAAREAIFPLLIRMAHGIHAPHLHFGHAEPHANGHTNGHANGHAPLPATAGGQLASVVRSPAGVLAAASLVFMVAGALITKGGLAGEGVYLNPLREDERDLMAWAAAATPPDSRFLVAPRSSWETDRESEWFPLLANRVSVATVQGFEWIDDGGFEERQELFWDAYDCGFKTTECLDELLEDYPDAGFDYIWVPRINGVQCCGTMVDSLDDDPNYTRVHDADGGTVWRREPEADIDASTGLPATPQGDHPSPGHLALPEDETVAGGG